MEWQEEGRSDMFFFLLIFLLLLLSIVVWVAFCIAAKKTARRLLELKRQRRREALITAAISHAAQSGDPPVPLYITTVAENVNVFERTEDLPTYEEALSMSSTPSPIPTSPQSNSVTTRSGRQKQRTLRVAPDRPGASPTMVLPPSYESSLANLDEPFSISNNIPSTSQS